MIELTVGTIAVLVFGLVCILVGAVFSKEYDDNFTKFTTGLLILIATAFFAMVAYAVGSWIMTLITGEEVGLIRIMNIP